jgi:hypothetical protein
MSRDARIKHIVKVGAAFEELEAAVSAARAALDSDDGDAVYEALDAATLNEAARNLINAVGENPAGSSEHATGSFEHLGKR